MSARRSKSSPAVSYSPMGVSSVYMMSPASMSWARYIVVTPDFSSPFRTAHCMGAAPRYLGSSEPCTFTLPSLGMARTSSGRILP